MVKELPVVYLPGASCTGCTISLLNSASPTIKNLLVDQVAPGVHLNLKFHPTIMASAGEMALQVMKDTITRQKGEYLLVVDGAISMDPSGTYASLAEVSMRMRVADAARDALAVIALGTCASFGGIPAAPPNPSQCASVREVLKAEGITTPLINIPGCPPHPDWFVGTLASIILGGLPAADALDEHLRPKAYYGKTIHENCPNRAWFDEQKFAKKLGDEGCLYELGCKGPITYSDCPLRRWNSGTNWVIGAGAPCNGCTQPEFADPSLPFYEKLVDVDLPSIGAHWAEKEAR